MSYERSVSAADRKLSPETVWNIRMPELRFGRDATEDLSYQLQNLDVESSARGLVVTDSNLADIGHAGRVEAHLIDAGFGVGIYNECEREPSVEAAGHCIEFFPELTLVETASLLDQFQSTVLTQITQQ